MGGLTGLLIGSAKHAATLELIAVALETMAIALEHIADLCDDKQEEKKDETR